MSADQPPKIERSLANIAAELLAIRELLEIPLPCHLKITPDPPSTWAAEQDRAWQQLREKWRSRGITDEQIERWFRNGIRMPGPCELPPSAGDVMTLADFHRAQLEFESRADYVMARAWLGGKWAWMIEQ